MVVNTGMASDSAGMNRTSHASFFEVHQMQPVLSLGVCGNALVMRVNSKARCFHQKGLSCERGERIVLHAPAVAKAYHHSVIEMKVEKRRSTCSPVYGCHVDEVLVLLNVERRCCCFNAEGCMAINLCFYCLGLRTRHEVKEEIKTPVLKTVGPLRTQPTLKVLRMVLKVSV